jgi:hypothetical protein
MGWEEDEENAYRTDEDMAGRAFRRGVRKGLAAVTFGLVSGSDPVTNPAKDAGKELVTKVIPRSMEEDDD